MTSKILPVYRQIYITLKNDIERGRFRSDKPLPNEMELAKRFGVARVTLRRTLALLEKEGIISRQAGRGTFLTEQDQSVKFKSSLKNLFETMQAAQGRYKVSVLENFIVPTPNFVSENCPNFGETSLQITRVSKLKKEPVHYSTQYLPTDLLKKVSGEKPSFDVMLLNLKQAGVETVRTDLVLGATLADIESASKLHVQPGTALITTKRISFDNHGKPLEFLDALTRPDQYEYVFRFGDETPHGELFL
jgi:GntR family transcriptional regulator